MNSYLYCVMIGDFPLNKARYCERFLELMVDIEAQLPLRRFVNSLVDDKHIVVHSKLSALQHRPEGSLFVQVRMRKEGWSTGGGVGGDFSSFALSWTVCSSL